jgi:tetratricopeptide (TPR) repeat protein
MRQFSAAAKYFELAANTNKMPQFFMNAGMTYERASDWESAMSSYHHCLTHSQQQFKPCHIKLAGIYNHMGDFQRVQQHLQLALQLDPTDVQAYTYLGDVYNNLKQVSIMCTCVHVYMCAGVCNVVYHGCYSMYE